MKQNNMQTFGSVMRLALEHVFHLLPDVSVKAPITHYWIFYTDDTLINVA